MDFSEIIEKALQICAQLNVGSDPKSALEVLKEATWIVERLGEQAHSGKTVVHYLKEVVD